MRQLDGGKTLPGARNRVAHVLFVIDVNLRHFPAARSAHVPLLLVRRRKRFIAGGDEHPVHGFALAGIAGIDIAQA